VSHRRSNTNRAGTDPPSSWSYGDDSFSQYGGYDENGYVQNRVYDNYGNLDDPGGCDPLQVYETEHWTRPTGCVARFRRARSPIVRTARR
jgi:hypothetical protein